MGGKGEGGKECTNEILVIHLGKGGKKGKDFFIDAVRKRKRGASTKKVLSFMCSLQRGPNLF